VSTANYNALAGALLTRGKLQPDGSSIGTGATLSQTVNVSGVDELVVLVDMTGAANGDLAVTVVPVEADNATVMALPLTAQASSGPTFGSGKVQYYGKFDVSAFEFVQVQIKNNNAGTQTLTRASWRSAGT